MDLEETEKDRICTCVDADTRIDDLIRNDEGYLGCFGHKGDKCQPDKVATRSDSGDAGAVRRLTFTA